MRLSNRVRPTARLTQPTQRLLRSIRQAWKLVSTAGRALVLGTFLIDVIAAAAIAAEVLLIGQIVEQLDAERAENVTLLLVTFGAVTAIRRLLTPTSRDLQWMISERVERSIVQRVLTHASTAPYEDFENPDFQDRLSRALRAAQGEAWGAVASLQTLISSLLTAAGLTVVVGRVAPKLLLPLLGAGLIVSAVSIINGKLDYRLDYNDTEPDRERRYLRSALSSRSEGKEIRLFGTAAALLQRHDRLYQRRLDQLHRVVVKRLVGGFFSSATLALAVVVVLIIIARSIENDSITLSAAAVAAVATQQLAGRIGTIATTIGALHRNTLFLDDLHEFVAEATEPHHHETTRRAASTIEFKNVSFQYPGTDHFAVEGISFTIRVGDVLALVGENGSGKTTLAKLAAGLYQPTEGEVLVDGKPLERAATDIVSALFQDFARYELSAAENVTLGAHEPQPETEIRRALEQAGAANAIDQLPEGAQTRLGRAFAGGLDLSTGQWQRLALARALYGQQPFVILDEPTSAMDPIIEAELMESFAEAAQNRGVLMITHRYSSVPIANHIIAIADGRIVEHGSHEDLIAQDGVYAHLYNLQARRYLR